MEDEIVNFRGKWKLKERNETERGIIRRPSWGYQTWPNNLSNVRKEIGMGNDKNLV